MVNESLQGEQSTRLEVAVEKSFEFGGRKWIFDASPLAVPYSLSTHLSEGGNEHLHPEFYLDWHNIVDNPEIARMHMYPGYSKDIPYETKLERMQKWVEAIQAYNSIMTDAENLSKSELEKLINGGNLPKPTTIVLETGTEGLRRLFKTLEFPVSPEKPNPFTPSWQKVVEEASSGKLLNTWIAQKGK